MASGFIAGGALAGIIKALLTGLPQMARFTDRIDHWAKGNRFYSGGASNWLSLIPWAILIALLYLTGREVILAHREVKT